MGQVTYMRFCLNPRLVPLSLFELKSTLHQLQELLGLVTDARVGGMLSGKAGIVHFHTGSADSLLQPLWDVVNASRGAIPLMHMIPTHVSNRGPALLKVVFLSVPCSKVPMFFSSESNLVMWLSIMLEIQWTSGGLGFSSCGTHLH